MATHLISILGRHAPDTTGRCWEEPYTVAATNDLFAHPIIRFADPAASQAHGIYGVFEVPQNYVGTAAIVLRWTSTATSGNCRWEFSYRAISGDDAESLDQASFQETVAVTDAAPSAAHERNTPSMSLTSANLAAGDTVEFFLKRTDDSGVDTMAADALLHDAMFSYADA